MAELTLHPSATQRVAKGLVERLTRQAGPYLVIELLLPGGTLFAFMLFLARSGVFCFSRASA